VKENILLDKDVLRWLDIAFSQRLLWINTKGMGLIVAKKLDALGVKINRFHPILGPPLRRYSENERCGNLQSDKASDEQSPLA